MEDTTDIIDIINAYWPKVREVYLSPLSNAADEIVGWQVEVMLTGGRTESWQSKSAIDAIKFAYLEIGKITH